MPEKKLASLFADDRRFWRFFALLAGAIAILKGLRFPVIWAASQAQADYREGFLKRGLFGEVCRRVHLNIADYRVFAILSLAILAAFLLMLFAFARSSRMRADSDGPLITLLAGSYCISYLVCMVGYLDILLAILALAVLAIRRPAAQLLAIALVGCFAVLVHEMYAVVFLPLTLLPFLLQTTAPGPEAPPRRTRSLLYAAIAFLLPWIAVAALTAHRALTPEQIAALKSSMLARVNFPAEPKVFDIYSLSALGNIRMMGEYLFTGSWVVLQLLAMAAFLPTTIYFLRLAFHALPEEQRRSPVLRVWMAVIVFGPLAMNIIAYDLYRWAALMSFNALLALLVVLRARSQRGSREAGVLLTPGLRHAACLLIALNLATNIGMFAHEGKDFPFYQYWSDFVSARHTHGSWIHP